MSGTPFLRLNVDIDSPSAPIITAENSRPIFPGPLERDALDHWDLHTDAGSLVGRLNGTKLVPNASAPTFNSERMKITDGYLNGLMTQFNDSASETIVVVMKHTMLPLNQRRIIITTQLPSDTAAGGSMIWDGGRSAQDGPNTMGYAARPGANLSSTTGLEIGVPIDAYVMYGFSRDNTNGRIMMRFGTGSVSDAGYAKTVANPMRNYSLGNISFADPDGTWNIGAEVAEFVIWNTRKTLAELNEIGARAMARMRYRGINLFTD